MAVDVERRVNYPASKPDHALLLRLTTSNAMSYDPASHTSGMGSSAVDTTSSQTSSADHLEYNDSSFPGQDTDPSPQQHSKQKRRSSKSKGPVPIRRSTSTPHMRNLALGASGELSPTTGDKRRNKLGYHRTSVACGHCRRRKIRCLLAPDDPQGRCANCIRLKKECNFYPVEHNPETQRSQTGAVKETSTGTLTNSATSSPRHPPPASAEKSEDFRAPFPGTPSGTMNSRFGVQSDMEIDPHHTPPTSGMPVQQPSYPFPPPIETQWPPATGFLPSSSIAESPSSSSGYWRPSPSTANSVYGSESNVSGGHTPAAMSTSSTMSYGPQDSHHWSGQPPFQTPARSMSYGNIEGLQQQYPNHQGLGIQPNEYPRRPSPYSYPTTIDTTPSTIHATTSGAFSSGPLSAPIIPNQNYNYPPTWNQYGAVQNSGPEMPMSARSMSAQWYPESGHFDQVPEEGAHPVPYGHNGMQPFYSGA